MLRFSRLPQLLILAVLAVLPSAGYCELQFYRAAIVNRYPHDAKAFTQGLLYHQGYLYESTGLYGHSSLRQVEAETGEVKRYTQLDNALFGEGLTRWHNELVQLTWKADKALIYSEPDLTRKNSIPYRFSSQRSDGQRQGWGLTSNSQHLILSDGSETLYFLNPADFTLHHQIKVSINGEALLRLNELEWVKGKLYANIWHSKVIVIIEPNSGQVAGVIDLRDIYREVAPKNRENVPNGIAYDEQNQRLFITGKRWPWLFEIRLQPTKAFSLATFF